MSQPNVNVPALAQLPKRQRRTLAMGLLAQTRGDYAEAMRCYQVAARRDPNDFLSLYFAALTSFQLKDKERAIRLMYASLKRHPEHPEAWYNLGKFYQDRAQLGKALECYVAALEHKSDFGQALVNLGNVYWELGDEETAETCYRKAMSCRYGGPEAVYNLSFLMHLKGDWPAAFEAAESRWQCPAYYREYSKPFMELLKQWQGEPLGDGQCLLLHGEQGHGDIIQMLRWIPMLQQRIAPAPLVVGVLDGLVRLVQTSFPGVRVVGTDADLSGCTHHLPSVSLPVVMKTTWDNLPPNGPYLKADEAKLEHGYYNQFRVGLCWAGSPTHPRDYMRSATFDDVKDLVLREDLEWVNLQMGPKALDWIKASEEWGGLFAPVAAVQEEDWDYLDTARLMSSCDLIITVDTSVAHLAGAMGIDCWMLCARFPDVRWMLHRDDTPWYPNTIIFRQTKAGEWGEVISIVRQLLDMKIQFRDKGL